MKKIALLLILSIALIGCEADQSAFSPDIEVSLSDEGSVDLNEQDLVISVENVGDINAFDIAVNIDVDGRNVERDTVSSLRAGENQDYTVSLSDVQDLCDTQDTLVAQAEPSVKDLNEANNEESIQIQC